MQKARIKEEKKLKSKPAVSSPELTNKVEEITLSAGIDELLSQSLTEKSQDYCGLGFFSRKRG